jgi:hypothetical protein
MTEVSGNSLDMMVVMNQSLMHNVARLHVRLGKERLRLSPSLPMTDHIMKEQSQGGMMAMVPVLPSPINTEAVWDPR